MEGDMTKHKAGTIIVEQLPCGEKVFVLGDLRFNILFDQDLATGQACQSFGPPRMKVLRKGVFLCKIHNLYICPGPDSIQSVTEILARTFFGTAYAQVFETGDILIFEEELPCLEENIVQRWYKPYKGDEPWKGKYVALECEEEAVAKDIGKVFRSLDLKSETQAEILAVYREKFKTLRNKIDKSLRRALPLPKVIRFA
jgi:hypothetical protein